MRSERENEKCERKGGGGDKEEEDGSGEIKMGMARNMNKIK